MASGLTHSAAHYLMAISDLITERGEARCIDIAQRLGITRGAALLALQNLQKKNLVVRDPNRVYRLTEKSRRTACHVRGNHWVLYRFFHQVLGLSTEEAEKSACQMAHLVSEEAALRLLAILETPEMEQLDIQLLLHQVARERCGKEQLCNLCSSFRIRSGRSIRK